MFLQWAAKCRRHASVRSLWLPSLKCCTCVGQVCGSDGGNFVFRSRGVMHLLGREGDLGEGRRGA